MIPLARTILQENIDPSFVDDLVQQSINCNREHIADILRYSKHNKFSNTVLDWMFDEYGDVIRYIMRSSYHPVMIKHLQDYTRQNNVNHRHIASHPFQTNQMFHDFFSGDITIDKNGIQSITEYAFDDNTMLLASSLVYTDEDILYMGFSKIKREDPDAEGYIKLQFIDKGFARARRQGLDAVSIYLKQRFPQHNLFELLNLDPEEIL